MYTYTYFDQSGYTDHIRYTNISVGSSMVNSNHNKETHTDTHTDIYTLEIGNDFTN